MEKDILFTSCQIRNKKAPNRFVSQPMEANDADKEGKVSQQAINRYKNLARGQWGIVIVEALSISRTSLARKNGMIINKANLDGFKKLVQEFKKINSECLLFFQITHAGQKSGDFSDKVSICPGAGNTFRYLQTKEIEEIRQAFVKAALLAEKSGADGIDFKMCHGYFGAEMLRPSNTRNDKWGGSFENRTRFLIQSIPEIKQLLNTSDFLIGARISMYEGIKGGCGTMSPEEKNEDLLEMKKLIKLMHELDMDYVNVSAGIPGVTSEVTRPVKQVKQLCSNHFRYTHIVKKLLNELHSDMKVIGSAYSALKKNSCQYAAENIQKGHTDFAGFGRQSFADPLFPKKYKNNEKINYCTTCSVCTELMVNQMHDGCAVYNQYYKELYKKLRQKK